MSEREVQFNVLVRSVGFGPAPKPATIDPFKPSEESIEQCWLWLVRQGVTCHPTEFGLTCSAPRQLFERLFATRLQADEPAPGRLAWRCLEKPQAPVEVSALVDQITLSAAPELF